MTSAEGKLSALRDRLRGLRRVAVAFSGGLDSSFLLTVAVQTLPDNVLAITLVSAAQPSQDIDGACAYSAGLGIPHRVENVDVFAIPGFVENSPQRCYVCKKEDFQLVKQVAAAEGFDVVCDGSTSDDTKDFRPGMKAARELGILSPLLEVGLTKAEVRVLAKSLGMPQWDRPASPCLASRIPYGTRITPEMLRQVQEAEAVLHRLGIREVRVRHHGTVARLEVPRSQFPVVFGHSKEIAAALKALGFVYVTLDIEGFRSGSLNEVMSR